MRNLPEASRYKKWPGGTRLPADAALFLWGADLSLTNLRFPGQYADAETALNQNSFRDYDPTIGRYVQSDPIGLLAGPNTYQYARANPMNETDPAGLVAQVCYGRPVAFPHWWLCANGTCSGFVPQGNSLSGELFGTPGMSRPESPASGICHDATPTTCNQAAFENCVASAMAQPSIKVMLLYWEGIAASAIQNRSWISVRSRFAPGVNYNEEMDKMGNKPNT